MNNQKSKNGGKSTKAPKLSPKKKHPGGRPPDYKPEYAEMAQFVIEDSGFSMFKLAKLFNVSHRTIYRWIEDYTKFCHAVEKGRTTWDGHKIHKSLVKRSVGFSYNETTHEADKDGTMVKTKVVRKYFPPDVAAMKHWQVNRQPDQWRDKHETEHSGDIKINIVRFNE